MINMINDLEIYTFKQLEFTRIRDCNMKTYKVDSLHQKRKYYLETSLLAE